MSTHRPTSTTRPGGAGVAMLAAAGLIVGASGAALAVNTALRSDTQTSVSTTTGTTSSTTATTSGLSAGSGTAVAQSAGS